MANKQLVKYHPDTRFLTDYAAGSLPESQALCVAAHLHHCADCRAHIRELTQVGTELFMEQPAAEVSSGCFDQVMARVAGAIHEPAKTPATAANDSSSSDAVKKTETVSLPRAISKMTSGNLENLKWRTLGKTFRYSTINTGDAFRESSLLEIKAGGEIPRHHHGGDEITVILKGSFSDQEDKYNVGDFIVRSQGETHTPVASQDEDCLCITTLDAPIKMNNVFYRMLMPFLNRPTSA